MYMHKLTLMIGKVFEVGQEEGEMAGKKGVKVGMVMKISIL